ncbi:MAG: hypothetical protein HRU20_24675 [Pseudomonadales bacterium]|nr:hypothetical protein [Pseudomonadales bacterium]
MEQVIKIEAAIEGLMQFFWMYLRTYITLLFSPHDASFIKTSKGREGKYISPLSFFAASAFIFSIVQVYVLVDIGNVYRYIFTNEILTLSVKDFLSHALKNLSEKNFSIWGVVTTILPVTIISLAFASGFSHFLEKSKLCRKELNDYFIYLAGFQCASFSLTIFVFLIAFVAIDSPFSDVPSIICAVFFFYSVMYSFISISFNYTRNKVLKNNKIVVTKYIVASILSAFLIFVFLETVEAKHSLLTYINKKERLKPIIEPLSVTGERPDLLIDKVDGNWVIKGAVQVYNPLEESLIIKERQVGVLTETNSSNINLKLYTDRWEKKQGPTLVLSSKEVSWVEYISILSQCDLASFIEASSNKTMIPYTINIDFYTTQASKKRASKYVYYKVVMPNKALHSDANSAALNCRR